ncbi:Teichoic acid translocation permease protein TagG [Pigmentiphaga humi]|uniref:Transport permease protein n=1 Tax=Pigmentiphaga humi TaxID=2478468 RepID=A0A3P4AZI4_9BURK|nr:ABC transporter permease [Pigmentiphaga humi]VCU69457.1 Teichoic acid translocation permease protein TagG [Pigmentiphaga humi]
MRTVSYGEEGPLASIVAHRKLIAVLSRRDVLSRYQGSLLGLLWAVVTPLLMLVVYTFVFSVIFNAKWGGVENRYQFALVLFAGLLAFNIFAEVVTRAPSLIVSHANYVTKVVFPVQVLPWVMAMSAVFNFAIGFCVWLAGYFVLVGMPHPQILWLPVLLVPYLLFVIGIAWFVSSIGVFVRDLGQVVSVAVTALLFMTPIFYPIAAIPPAYQRYMYLNPITFVVESLRSVMIDGTAPDWRGFAWFVLFALLVHVAGFVWFQRIKKGFADVL